MPSEARSDRRPYDQQLGHAFAAFLESVDPKRLPLHGGDATTVIVTIDHRDLPTVCGAGVALVGDEPITAGQARRLACTANIIPAVLGGDVRDPRPRPRPPAVLPRPAQGDGRP